MYAIIAVAIGIFWCFVAVVAGVPLLLAIVIGALCGCGVMVILNVCAACGSVDDER